MSPSSFSDATNDEAAQFAEQALGVGAELNTLGMIGLTLYSDCEHVYGGLRHRLIDERRRAFPVQLFVRTLFMRRGCYPGVQTSSDPR
jgi:hypothetical protein